MTVAIEKAYKLVNGTSYSVNADDKVIAALEQARIRGERIRVFYGDAETGRDWMEEHDVLGYVGRSTGGTSKAPILVHNSRSMGGTVILDHCIVKIMAKGGRVLYQHPTYNQPELFVAMEEEKVVYDIPTDELHTHRVQTADDVLAYFPNEQAAERWKAFITGERFGK